MGSTNIQLLKNIALGFAMLIFVAVTAFVSYTIVYNRLKPNMLIAPTNLYLLENNVLTWDDVEGSSAYDIRLFNRTTEDEAHNTTNVRVYDTVYTVNDFNKVLYNISYYINEDQNYSISVKAISSSINDSGYGSPYELEQADPLNDKNPYRLTEPRNLTFTETKRIAWDNMPKADSYTLQILNRTDNVTVILEIDSTLYSVNEFNQALYYAAARIEESKNYSITLRANSTTIVLSDFCEAYEIVQVDPSGDLNPYIED